MSTEYRFLNMKKEILELQYQIILQYITSLRLSIDRVEEAIEFTESEIRKVEKFIQHNISPIQCKLHIHMPIIPKDLDGNLLSGIHDYVNFGPQKAPLIIKDDDSLNYFMINSKGAIDHWKDIGAKFNDALDYNISFAKRIFTQINLLKQKIEKSLYDENSFGEVDTSLDKKRLNKYELIAENYIMVCTKLESDNPTYEQLAGYFKSKPSKSSWHRHLKDLKVLESITKALEKKLNRKNINDREKNLLIKINIDIKNKVQKIENKMYQRRARPIKSESNEIEEEFKHISQKFGNFN